MKRRVLLSVLKSSQDVYQLSKNRDSFKSLATPDAIDRASHVVFRFLVLAGLGELGSRAAGVALNLRWKPGV